MAYRLGIDLGTTNTVASVAADGAPVQLATLGSRSQQTRSMVFLAEDGQFLAGDPAADKGASDSSRLIIDPRRHLGTDVPMVVGGQEVTAEQATAALINFVVRRATAQQHQPPSETVLSYPVHWDEYKVECFDRAIAAANLGTVRTCTDAEAAVATYAARESLGDSRRVAVYDLGGGSCEATVLEKTPDGTRVLGASEGADHPSGADFDEAVFRLVLSNLGDRGRDLDKDDTDSQLRLAKIKRACTQAKEALSSAAEAQVPVSLPGYQTTIRLGRQEFVSLVRPALRESVAMTGRVLHAAGVQASDLAAIILVGGCCRMPVVAELLQREFGAPIALGTHPEYDVAIGTLLTSHPGQATTAGPAALPTIAAISAGAGAPEPVEEPLAADETPAAEDPTAEEAVEPEDESTDAEQAAAQQAVPEQPQPQRPAAHQPEPANPAVPAAGVAVAAVAADSAQEDATVISEAPRVWVPAAAATTPASAPDHPPVPAPQAPAPIPEETMPNHLIFDYFTSADPDADETIPGQSAYATEASPPIGASTQPGTAPTAPLPPWAQASAAVPPTGSPAVGSSPTPQTARYGAQMASSSYPPGQRPPGSPPMRPGSAPSPGGYPPGQYPGPLTPGSPGARPPGYPPGPPTQPYGARGPGGPGGYPPGPGGVGPDGSGSRRRLILIVAGVVVLVGAAVAAGVLISRSGEPGSTTASPSVFFPPASPPASPTPSASPSATPTASSGATPTGAPSPSTAQTLPSSPAIPQNMIVVPMRFDGGPDRPLYLVDSEGKVKQIELPSPEGGNSNPIMHTRRDTIIYLNAGVLRVMAADGSGDRKLFNRDPAGCRRVENASWSLADSNVILINCRVSRTKSSLLLVDLDGRLIRRLDTGKRRVSDTTLSPDGQTVLYWASDTPEVDGGALYTLPIIGTGAPKRLTTSADGVDADPAWSPDGSQIAFRRLVHNGISGRNEDVFVMNADGSGARAVTSTPAADFKPMWSPDNKNLLIISNRKSDFGGPGSSFDLWLTRVSDGEVLGNLGLKARQITRSFWTLR